MPSNDICVNAIGVSVGECFQSSNLGATPSNNPTPTLSCGQTLSSDSDVWFVTNVPPSGNLTIQTSSINNSFFSFSMSVEVYRGSSCQSLTSLACSHYTERFNSNQWHALVEFENMTPNETLFIRVADQGPTTVEDDFEICISDSGYSNHQCKIQYVEAGPSSVCDHSTNTFSQMITVHYYDDGSSTFLRINDIDYPLTGSPMTVQVQDLAASGNQINLEIFLSSQNFNECFVNSYYFKDKFFDPVANCYSGVIVNDNCTGAIDIPVSAVDCAVQFFDLTGANSSMPSFDCFSILPIPQDLWFKVTVPQSGEVIIHVTQTSTSSSTYPTFAIYEGSCNNLNMINSCGNAAFSKRLMNRTPGEILYVRTTYRDNWTQGEFGICAMDPQTNAETCQGAIPLSISSECFPTSIYSTHFSIAENFPLPNLTCSSNNNSINDIWFSLVVPSTGELAISLNYIGDSFLQAEILTSNCSFLNSIDCQSGSFSQLDFNLSGRIPGEILLLRVAASEQFRPTTFTICASSSCPDSESISYFINGQREFEDHISITADNRIENTADVIYDAGQYVLLNPGFEVIKSGIFHALIDGCN